MEAGMSGGDSKGSIKNEFTIMYSIIYKDVAVAQYGKNPNYNNRMVLGTLNSNINISFFSLAFVSKTLKAFKLEQRNCNNPFCMFNHTARFIKNSYAIRSLEPQKSWTF